MKIPTDDEGLTEELLSIKKNVVGRKIGAVIYSIHAIEFWFVGEGGMRIETLANSAKAPLYIEVLGKENEHEHK